MADSLRDYIIRRVVERESYIGPNSKNTAFEMDNAAIIVGQIMLASAKPVQAILISCSVTNTDTGNGSALSNSQQENETGSEV